MRKTRSQTQAENAQSSNTSSRTLAARTEQSSVAIPAPEPTQISGQSRSAEIPETNRVTAPQIDPSKLKEYEDMIPTLRVFELQKVLSFVSTSVAGRKTDLQRRVSSLLKVHFELISSKIKEIYLQSISEQQQQTLQSLQTHQQCAQYGPTAQKRMFSHMQVQPVQPGNGPDVRSAMLSAAGGPGNAMPCVGGANNMSVPFQHTIQTSLPIHPDVRLKKLAFYDVLGTLIKPSTLLPRNTQRIQEVAFYFTLTPQQINEIAVNRDAQNGSKVEHAIQVQLRFCLYETSCDQEDCFPPNVIVKVNNKLCPLPNPIPTNRPNVEPKRPPRPVNVTANVKLSPCLTNTVTVQWCPDFARGYCIAGFLVKKLTSTQLLHRMKTKGIKPADYTRGLIKEKLTEDADCEIATTMLKVSLNCPLGKMKMSLPCRASTCSHLQCFDASLYLQMNERKPTWNCPVCDKPAVYDNLVIDGYFQEVLASSILGSDDTEIQLHKDGSWSTQSQRPDLNIHNTQSKPIEKVEVISDDIEVITTEDIKENKSPPPSVSNNDQPTSTTNSETVDLTLSDSDDDDLPLAKRRPTPASKSAAPGTATSSTNGSAGERSLRGGHYVQQKLAFKKL